jgi:manganese/iron transport system permease protein
VFFVGAFALGIVIISRAPGYPGSLQEFVFGSITGIPTEYLYIVGITGLMLLSPLIGGSAALVGLYLSWSFDLTVGGTIVLVLTAMFLVAWLLAPTRRAHPLGQALVLSCVTTLRRIRNVSRNYS